MRALASSAIAAAVAVPLFAMPAAHVGAAPDTGHTPFNMVNTAHQPINVETPGILYAVDANDARITKTRHGLRLTLPARGAVTWFTDRPERRSGTIKLTELTGIWRASGFTSDPPNAALIVSGSKGHRTHVVELTRPRSNDKQVSFRIRALPRQQEVGYRHTHEVKVGQYRHARLFIDDAALPPCGTVIWGPRSGSTAPSLMQCLLAPGTVPESLTVYNQAGTTTPSGKTIITVCASGVPTTSTALPSITAGWPTVAYPVKGCAATYNVNNEAWIGTYGFDAYGAAFPQPNPNSPSETFTYCPAPERAWTFSNPANSGVTLRVTVQFGEILTCPYAFMYYSS